MRRRHASSVKRTRGIRNQTRLGLAPLEPVNLTSVLIFQSLRRCQSENLTVAVVGAGTRAEERAGALPEQETPYWATQFRPLEVPQHFLRRRRGGSVRDARIAAESASDAAYEMRVM